MNKYLKAAVYGAAITLGSVVAGAVTIVSSASVVAGPFMAGAVLIAAGSVAVCKGASFRQMIVGTLAAAATTFGLVKMVKATLPNQGPFERRTEVKQSTSFNDNKKTVYFNHVAANIAQPLLKKTPQLVRTLNS